MKKDELFKRVYIKSKEDLPKEGTWIVCVKKFVPESSGLDLGGRYMDFKSIEDIPSSSKLDGGKFPYSKEWWLQYVDWYLLPVERQPNIEIKTAEEILNKAHNKPHLIAAPHYVKEAILEAMEEYASQFKRQPDNIPVQMPNDEEIEKKYPTEIGQSVIMEPDMTYAQAINANEHRQQGAKWVRSQIKLIGLR